MTVTASRFKKKWWSWLRFRICRGSPVRVTRRWSLSNIIAKCLNCTMITRFTEVIFNVMYPSITAHTKDVKIYPTRFWILGVFSFLGWFQCLQWNLWGSMSESVEAAFPGWGSETVAMMANWGTLTFSAFVVPMVWFMNHRGLRHGALLCSALVAGGTVVKIISFTSDSQTFFTVMCHIGAILNGIAGTLIMSAPPMIAALWFPPQERTTATAVSQVLNQLGSAGSYLQPLVVRAPSEGVTPEDIRKDIRRLLYTYAGIGTAVFVIVVVYFPSKPPTPPSLSSQVDRLSFKTSLKKILKNRDILLITAAYSMCIAVPSAWLTVLNYSLSDLGMGQTEAMWVGLSAVLIQGATGLLVGRFTDLVYGHVKLSLLVFMVTSLASFFWFYILTTGTVTVTTWQIFMSVWGGLAFNFGTAPMFFELAVEIAYPCPELVIAGLLTGTMNILGLCFYLLFFIPNVGYQWVIYVLLGSSSCSMFPLMLVREDYSRSSLDRNRTDHSNTIDGNDNHAFSLCSEQDVKRPDIVCSKDSTDIKYEV